MRVLAAIGVLAIVVAVGAAAFFFVGFYSVDANQEEPALVAAALIKVRQASIAHHAVETPPIKLDDDAVVKEGARAFAASGCINCHGAPGVKWAKFSEGLNPGPPDLAEEAAGRDPREIFWIVKHGIGMTGMPSFGNAGLSDREIWAIAAFVKRLPKVSEQDFKAWSEAK
ncbi:MAG: c-type cytochrome [Acidobacteriota bacterium]